MYSAQHASYSLRFLLTALFKHRYRILLTAIVAVMATAVLSFVLPRQYESHSSLLLKPGREYMYTPEAMTSAEATVMGLNRYQPNEVANSALQVLNSREIKERVVKELGAENIYPKLAPKNTPAAVAFVVSTVNAIKERVVGMLRSLETSSGGADREDSSIEDKAIRMLEDDFHAETVKDANVVHLYVQNQDPEVAAKILQLMMRFFIDKHVELYRNERLAFTQDVLQEYKKRLDDAEVALASYREQNGMFDIDEQKRLLLQQRSNLDSAIKDALRNVAQSDGELEAVNREMAKVPESIPLQVENVSDPVGSAKQRLLELQLEIQKYSDNSPLAAQLRRQIDETREFLKQQESAPITSSVRKGRNPIFDQLEGRQHIVKTERDAVKAQLDTLKGQLADVNASLRMLNDRENQLNQLERERDANEQAYKAYQVKAEEARVAEELDEKRISNVTVVEKPTVPTQALGLRRLAKVLLAGVLGVLIALAVVARRELTRGVVIDAEDLAARLGLRVLAVCPESKELTR